MLARTQALEGRLLALKAERNELEAESARMPSHTAGRTLQVHTHTHTHTAAFVCLGQGGLLAGVACTRRRRRPARTLCHRSQLPRPACPPTRLPPVAGAVAQAITQGKATAAAQMGGWCGVVCGVWSCPGTAACSLPMHARHPQCIDRPLPPSPAPPRRPAPLARRPPPRPWPRASCRRCSSSRSRRCSPRCRA